MNILKNSYLHAASGMYINYFLYGMVNIILASHMSFLTESLHTNAAGISLLVSAIGFGRLATLYVSGLLSDRFGRKPFIIIAGILMAVFLVGIPLSPNLGTAVIFAVLAGVANACMDSGTYPALIEAFPKAAGSATVLVRGVISVGASLLPIMILFIMNQGWFYGYAFFLPAVIFLLNTFLIYRAKFPSIKCNDENKETKTVTEEAPQKPVFHSPPKFRIEGLCLILLGFTGPALLYVMQLWLPTYGQQMIGLTEAESLKLISYYNIGSLVSVFFLVIALSKWLKPVSVILLYPILSLFAFILLLTVKSHMAVIAAVFLIGFTISGVLQLSLTVMSEFFSERKGQITGFMYTATSISYTTIPFVTGLLLEHFHVRSVFELAVAINLISIVLAIVVNYRYASVFFTRTLFFRKKADSRKEKRNLLYR
ncbi:putative MFS-type transporter YfkL [Paenibacillus sp. J45TS6]|uniref:MFS transporter n=1 Tax=Paenibacillus sp. J45TS6 TaxID=2807196 RepID=UPI001B12F288|nr:MFS transporter [Paenibacillus sp. J45TS6]GIP44773.1 putative MFS-type transporter YfkL [Paenibacillus sp. J45TS6]